MIYRDDDYIEAIFKSAFDLVICPANEEAIKAAERVLSDAIDAAMSHAYADGRDDERREWLDKEMREATSKHTSEAIARIWDLPGAKHAA